MTDRFGADHDPQSRREDVAYDMPDWENKYVASHMEPDRPVGKAKNGS